LKESITRPLLPSMICRISCMRITLISTLISHLTRRPTLLLRLLLLVSAANSRSRAVQKHHLMPDSTDVVPSLPGGRIPPGGGGPRPPIPGGGGRMPGGGIRGGPPMGGPATAYSSTLLGVLQVSIHVYYQSAMLMSRLFISTLAYSMCLQCKNLAHYLCLHLQFVIVYVLVHTCNIFVQEFRRR
jgi:hypothetical protein